MQVHGGDQAPLPPLWNSFVGTSIHNGPVPPATLKPTEENPRSFTSVQMVHTQYIYIYIYTYIYRYKTRVDLLSDPSGTESPNVQLD